MPSMIKDLLNPSSLPDRTKEVSLVQTHISLVLVMDEFVYKIKKPVNFGFLDFSTLAKREYYCHQELRLNQRLSRDIYLDVLPVTYDGKRYRIGKGRGQILEYAVKMRKIPDEVVMKSLFYRGKLREENLREIAHLLAEFHKKAHRSREIDLFGKPDKVKINTDENFRQTEKYIHKTIQEEDFHILKQWTEDFYGGNRALFGDRIVMGKIRDCHGDLHMEHVCLTKPICIIDCIEFNDRFRYSDTISDIAFLLMDLEYHEGRGLAERLWDYYSVETGEKDADHLLTFYKVYRAYVRGKVNSFQFDDENLGAADKGRKENYESNALTEQAYLNNKQKFEPVDLEDLKNRYPSLNILHLRVDTTSDLETEWFIIDKAVR